MFQALYNIFRAYEWDANIRTSVVNQKPKIGSTLTTEHIGLQTENNFDLEVRCLCKMFISQKDHFKNRTHGLWGMETAWAIDLSGINGTRTVHLDKW